MIPSYDRKAHRVCGSKGEQTAEQKLARERMALFPVGAEVLFVKEELYAFFKLSESQTLNVCLPTS